LPYAICILRALLDVTDPSIVGHHIDSPLFEHHAVFALELSAGVLLSHRKREKVAWTIFDVVRESPRGSRRIIMFDDISSCRIRTNLPEVIS